MGCGGSKLDPNGEGVQARLRPILRRRIEEIRARKSRKSTTDASKKELLRETTVSDHDSDEELEEEVTTSTPPPPPPSDAFQDTQDNPPTPHKIEVDTTQILSHEVDENGCETVTLTGEQLLALCESNKGDDGDSSRRRQALLEEMEIEEELYADESGICPGGSPSFRVYCKVIPDQLHSRNSSLEEELIDEKVEDEGEPSEDQSRVSISQESTSSNEVLVKQTTKKGKFKRVRIFRIRLKKGGKSIFHHMPSFHNFSCSSRNASNLQKAAAA